MDNRLGNEERSAREDAARWHAIWEKRIKERGRLNVIGLGIVFGGLAAAYLVAQNLGAGYALLAGAAWMAGIWWLVSTERSIQSDLEQALERSREASEKANSLRRQI